MNAGGFTSSKTNVARHHATAFGYPLDIDPTRHRGPMLVKSDANAMHDGRVIRGPIRADQLEPGMVYERLVDATLGPAAMEFRIPIMDGIAPFLLLRVAPAANRFKTTSPATRRPVLSRRRLTWTRSRQAD